MTGTSGSGSASLAERAAADGTTFVLATFVDLDGKPCANYLRTLALALATTMLARACGRSDVHRLEPEDLVALPVEAAALAGVPLAGTDRIPGR
nr:hypothetical protein [Candidatus Frankia alpina]